MASYVVVEQCAWTNTAGTQACVAQPGAIVDLDDTEAAALGDAVKPVGGPKPKRREKPAEAPKVDSGE